MVPGDFFFLSVLARVLSALIDLSGPDQPHLGPLPRAASLVQGLHIGAMQQGSWSATQFRPCLYLAIGPVEPSPYLWIDFVA